MNPIYVLTNDNHLWLLRGFAYLHNIFWRCPVKVFGYAEPGFNLPDNFSFKSLGVQRPIDKWSTGLIEMTEQINEKFFILMLEDYWLIDKVNKNAIEEMFDVMPGESVLRLDLSGNRASYRHNSIITTKHCQIIKSYFNARYQMSFQAGIWNKDLMLKILKRNENPWQAEIKGTKRVRRHSLNVWGTKPAILKYKPVYRARQNKLILDKVPFQKAMKRRGII